MNLALWTAIGVGVGALAGSVFFDNVALGIAVGIGVSLAVGGIVAGIRGRKL